MELPRGPLPVPAVLAPITDQELASCRRTEAQHRMFGRSSNPAARADFTLQSNCPSPIRRPAMSCIPGNELNDWLYQTGQHVACQQGLRRRHRQAGSHRPIPGMPAEYIPFQSSRALKQTVALGSVEEWTIFNMNNIQHPFHIHINPCWVVKVNGQPIEPYWADTIPLPSGGHRTAPTSVTFRSRFSRLRRSLCNALPHAGARRYGNDANDRGRLNRKAPGFVLDPALSPDPRERIASPGHAAPIAQHACRLSLRAASTARRF